MAAIATSLDATYTRVGVSLSGWAADGVVPVYRVHQDGSRNVVRGMSAVSGGVAFGWDYESPLSAPVTYEAWDGSTLATSAETTLTMPAPAVAYLTAPGLPSFGGPVMPTGKVAMRRNRPTASLDVIGRATPIVKSDVMKAPAFTLGLRTYSDSGAYTLTSLMSVAPVLLLRIPGTRVTDWCYIATGDVSDSPVTHYGRNAPGANVTAEWADWQIECQVVESPVGGVFGDPTSTYQAGLDARPTYQDRLAANPTYIDALRG